MHTSKDCVAKPGSVSAKSAKIGTAIMSTMRSRPTCIRDNRPSGRDGAPELAVTLLPPSSVKLVTSGPHGRSRRLFRLAQFRKNLCSVLVKSRRAPP